uniref:Uncharacterized protein n=1 Tax=Anguilla anguilla TaxID=7936 RepID=A0A0E9XFE9_ANGAN
MISLYLGLSNFLFAITVNGMGIFVRELEFWETNRD